VHRSASDQKSDILLWKKLNMAAWWSMEVHGAQAQRTETLVRCVWVWVCHRLIWDDSSGYGVAKGRYVKRREHRRDWMSMAARGLTGSILGRCVEAHEDDYGGDFDCNGHVCFRSIDWR
jgi:hypothetical protein